MRVRQFGLDIDVEFTAGSPFPISYTDDDSGLVFSSPTVTLKSAAGDAVSGTAVPAVSVAGNVLTCEWDAIASAAMNTTTGKRGITYLFEVQALVDGEGPYPIFAGSVVVWPKGVVSTSGATSYSVAGTITLGGAAISGSVMVGHGTAARIAIADAGGFYTADDIEGALQEAAAALLAHLADTSAAHAASAIGYNGSANLAATDVEAALDELDTEKVQIGGEASASSSSTTPVTVKGTTGQTADLLVAKNVGGTVVAKIGADGTITSAGLHLSSSGTRAVRHDSSAQLGIGEGYQVVTIRPGASGVKGVVLFSSSGTGLLASGEGVLYIANATVAPSGTPSGGGIVYCEGGALKFKGSSGTVTTIAAA